MPTLHISCLKPLIVHVMCNELVAKVLDLTIVLHCTISLSKNSHVAYSHHPYKMSHVNNLPCSTEYSHYQSRGMCKIPTLFTFLSNLYELRVMKGNFGKFPHWDTSESSMCKLFLDHNRLNFYLNDVA